MCSLTYQLVYRKSILEVKGSIGEFSFQNLKEKSITKYLYMWIVKFTENEIIHCRKIYFRRYIQFEIKMYSNESTLTRSLRFNTD